MADLIAQSADLQYRWRRPLPVGRWLVLGREGALAVPWDEHVSRSHAQLRYDDGRLEVRRVASARNPIFVHGNEIETVEVLPGEHFVIGTTTFTLADDEVEITQALPAPAEEHTFSSKELQRLRFRNADRRIDVLSRLPEVISEAADEAELFVRLVNLLLVGIGTADAAALVEAGATAASAASPRSAAAEDAVRVFHWDRRLEIGGEFSPSERLIREAVRKQQSVLHVWQTGEEPAGPAFTLGENCDWAFCTPVPGAACKGWAIYVSGRFRGAGVQSGSGDSTAARTQAELRDDLKFTELVAQILSSLRRERLLQRNQAVLSQFFSPAVLGTLADDPEKLLAPQEADVSVLFCDLRGFSREAEKLAGDLVELLERVSKALGVMTHHILEHGGVVGDFQGDAALAFWGWPLAQPDAVARACQAALGIRAHFETVAAELDNPLADFRAGIGMATGRAVAGRIGTQDQVKVTVFGPVVNLASRLEGMTKILHAPILVDEATAEAVRHVPSEVARCRRVARVKPYGLDTPLMVSELLPPASVSSSRERQRAGAVAAALSDADLANYEAALDAFLAGRWPEAFELLHRVPPEDRVKDFLTVFIAQHNRTPPKNWDGVIPLSSKS